MAPRCHGEIPPEGGARQRENPGDRGRGTGAGGRETGEKREGSAQGRNKQLHGSENTKEQQAAGTSGGEVGASGRGSRRDTSPGGGNDGSGSNGSCNANGGGNGET